MLSSYRRPFRASTTLAQEQGLEPWTLGFGDRCSTN